MKLLSKKNVFKLGFTVVTASEELASLTHCALAHARPDRSAIATGRASDDSVTRHRMIRRRRACCHGTCQKAQWRLVESFII
jgi:hypothetical protein